MRDDIDIEGDDSLGWYQSSTKARRGFCRNCGSNIFYDHDDRNTLAIMAGTLDQPTGLKLAIHIYVDDAADYEIIDDGLPKLSKGHSLTYP